MALEEVGLRLSAEGVVQTTTGVNLSGKAVEDLGKKADVAAKQVARVGVSAAQTTQAMRQLPMQITDIVTGLASGQSAFTVFIQQGGQLKDSFGGAAPAARALLGAISPMAAVLGGAAAGAGVLALAYINAARETSSFHRAVELSGFAAGVSAGQLAILSRGLSGLAGQGAAAEVLAQLAGSGQVSADSMRNVAQSALEMQRITGRAAADTVKEFIELGRAPVEASKKLNEQTNFLTAAVYEQIKALVEQGRTAAAGALAQQAYFDVMNQRMPVLKKNMGDLEQAWDTLGSAARRAWSNILGVGRDLDLDQKLAQARAVLEQRRTARSGDAGREAAYREEERRQEAEVKRLETEKSAGAVQAQQAGARAAEEKRRIAAIDAVDKADDSAMTNAQRRVKLLADYRRQQAEAGRADDKKALDAYQAYLERAYADPRAARGAKPKEREIIGEPNTPNTNFRRMEAAGYDQTERDLRQQYWQDVDRERKAREQATKQEQAERTARAQTAERDAEALRREAEALAMGTEEIGLTSQALLQLRLRRMDDAIAQKEQELARLEGLDGYEREADAIRNQIRLLGDLKGKTSDRADTEKRDDKIKTAEERTKTVANSIEQGLKNGFGAGRSIAEAFRNELIDTFSRTYLRPKLIDPLAGNFVKGVDSASGWLSSLFTMFGFHSGGVGQSESSFTRVPKFHSGTGPDEMNAVIRRTEGVFTAGQMKAMAPLSEVAKASATGAGTVVHFAPQVNIDARTDKAEVFTLVGRAMQVAQAQLLDKMNRRMA